MNMNFEERLIRAIEEAEISQSELGRRIDVNSQTVSHWCNAGVFQEKKSWPLASSAWEASVLVLHD
jgi:DNA-binding XRE family transcriptional regulator